MTILIVDDSKAMRMIVRRTLRQAGYPADAVAEASDGREALAAIQENQPDVMLCDWNMPQMTGIELLRSLKESGVSPKFGFVTSESTPDMRAAAFDAGASFFITKPFTPDSFQTALDPLLGL